MKILILLTLSIYFLYSSTIYKKISSQVGRLNPIISVDATSSTISSYIFNSLIKYDKNANIIPSLTKKFYFINNKTLIFELKKNILWHDGEQFDASDVIFTFNLIKSKKIFSPISSSFKYVKSVEAINNYKIKVTYTKQYYKALEIWLVSIVPKHILDKQDDIMNSDFNKHPIGTGAYKLKEIKPNKDIVLEANKNYFQGKPKIDTIHFRYLPDTLTSFLMLKQEKIDQDLLSPIKLQREVNREFKEKFSIYEKPSYSYTYLGFNLKIKKFKNKKIREAINFAINKKEIVEFLFFGHGKVCYGPFLPFTKAFNKNIKHNFSQNRAREILKSLGYNKDNIFKFEVVTNSNNQTRKYAAMIIQKQLAEVGIEMKIRTMEWQAFLNTVVRPSNFESILLGWSMPIKPDARSIWHSSSIKKGGYNFISYRNKKVDMLIEKAETTINKKRFFDIYKKIFTIIASDIPYLFLYIPNDIEAINKRVQNVTQSYIGIEHNFIDWGIQIDK
jgi:peptide/nickel transport system substrate-binding protein